MYLKFLFIAVISFTVLAEENGYEVFTKAYEKIDKRKANDSEYQTFYADSSLELSPAVLGLLEGYEPAMKEIVRAGKMKKWENATLKELSSDTAIPYFAKQSIVAKLAVIKCRSMLREGNRLEAFLLLNSLHQSSLRDSKGHMLIQTLFMMACRGVMRRIQVEVVDDMGIDELKKALKSLQFSCAFQIEPEKLFDGERVVTFNTVRLLFEGLSKELKPEWDKLLEGLEKSGVDQEALAKIKGKEILSEKQWEEPIQQAFKKLYDDIVPKVYLSTKELEAFQKKYYEDIWEKGESFEKEVEKFTEVLKTKDLKSVEVAHKKVGERMKNVLLDMMSHCLLSLL